MSEQVERSVVRHALSRGFITAEQVRRAALLVDELRRAGRPAGLLAVLRAQGLPPACLPELTDVYRRACAATPGSGPSFPSPPIDVPAETLLRANAMHARPAEQDPEHVRREYTFDGAATQQGATRAAPSERLRAAAPPAGALTGRRALVEAYRAELARDPHFAPHADVALESLGELGRGGMGVVYRVRDHRLGREAAMKVILGSATPRQVQRFLREARITAGLDHPAIPPVHEAGTDAAGRHYLLMRVIHGQSLAERVEALHARAKPGATSTPTSSEVSRELLEALVKVSEAVAYAHSKGVVHRDLKPANVMVGSFGEVMLMDWGVARELACPDEPDEPQEKSAVEPGLTQEGALVGTLGYMPPEQAQGRSVDARADVYALGAVLVELLTGRPPVTGKNALSMIRDTVEGRIQLPRDRRRDAPAELHDLAAQALAQDASARPDAAGFAADLRAYLAGGEVSAHRYSRLERATRAARRHPTLLVGALGVVLFAGALGGLGTWALGAGRRAEGVARATQAVAARAAAEQALADLGAGKGERLALALRALGATQRWREATRDAASTAAVTTAARALGDVALSTQQWDLAQEALILAGDVDAASTVARARGAETERRKVEVQARLERLRAGMDDDAEEAGFDLARYPEPAIVEVLAAALDGVSARLEAQAGQEKSLARGEVDLAKAACAALGRLGLPARATEALARYLAAETDQVRAAEAGLGLCRLGTDDALALVHAARESERFGVNSPFSGMVQRGLARRSRGPVPLEAETAAGYVRRGTRREAQGDRAGAVEDYTRALQLDGQFAMAFNNRGIVRHALGDDQGAVEDCTRALELDPRDATAYINRGTAREALGDDRGAIEDYTRGIDLDPRYATAYYNRGNARHTLGDNQGALEDYTRSIELDPRDPSKYLNRGRERLALGDQRGALEDCTRALELDPRLAVAYRDRGAARFALGDPQGAIEDCTRALELEPEAAKAYSTRGCARYALGDHQGAVTDCTRALELDPRDAMAHTNRGVMRLATGDVRGAIEDCTQAIELDPRLAAAYATRGAVRHATGDVRGAIEDFTRAIELDPLYAVAYTNRGIARGDLSDHQGALRDFTRAIELDPRVANAYVSRANARGRLGDHHGAVQDCDRALELDRRCATAHKNRAVARAQLGDAAGAIADFERFLELAPGDSEAPTIRAQLERLRRGAR